MKESAFINILKSFVPVIAVAALGSLFVYLGMDRYGAFSKPGQWPSSALFPIVWTVIYSIAAVILFNGTSDGAFDKMTNALFIINGALNVLWCLLFFTLGLTFIGLIAIILNLVSGFFLVFELKRYKNAYFYALVVYPIWLSLATALNAAIWILN